MNGRALLLSLKPRFAEAIFEGRKTVELRRVPPRVGPGDLVFVYVTSPRCLLEGAFEVSRVLHGSPGGLWKAVREHCGLAKAEYRTYFSAARRAYGIVIRRSWRLDSPVDMAFLRAQDIRPPQGYRYLDGRFLGRLKRRCVPAVTS